MRRAGLREVRLRFDFAGRGVGGIVVTRELTSRGSDFYQHSGAVPLASRLSMRVRRKMFDLFMRELTPGPDATVLDIGVTSDTTFRESNYFEKLYPHPHRITCVGTEDGSHLMHQFPGLRYQQVSAGSSLPFRDREFDIVFSNAVIQHTGSRRQQAAFAREACRVGKAFFITTPCRWFPFEHHTGLPFLHYLPPLSSVQFCGARVTDSGPGEESEYSDRECLRRPLSRGGEAGRESSPSGRHRFESGCPWPYDLKPYDFRTTPGRASVSL